MSSSNRTGDELQPSHLLLGAFYSKSAPLLLNCIAAGMLAYTIYIGDHGIQLPWESGEVQQLGYSYFLLMRWIVGAACLWSATYLFLTGGWRSAISALLMIMGVVHILARMSRDDWKLPNMVTAALLILASAVIGIQRRPG